MVLPILLRRFNRFVFQCVVSSLLKVSFSFYNLFLNLKSARGDLISHFIWVLHSMSLTNGE